MHPRMHARGSATTTNRIPSGHPTRADCHLSKEALALMHLAILTLTV